MAPYYLGLKSGDELGWGEGESLQRMLRYEFKWHRLGPRLYLLAGLTSVAVVSTILAIGQSFLRCSRRRVLTICILCLCWGGFLALHSYLDIQFLSLRARGLVPQCKLAAEVLTKEWPAEDGVLPGAGDFRVGRERIPNYLFLELKYPYAVNEQLGYSIERSASNTLYFGMLARADWEIEYHADRSIPSSYESEWGDTLRPSQSFELDDGWYLVQYERTRAAD